MLVGLPVLITLAAAATTNAGSGWLAKTLGRMSYLIYAIHAPLVEGAAYLHAHQLQFIGNQAFWPTAIMVIVAASWFVAVALD